MTGNLQKTKDLQVRLGFGAFDLDTYARRLRKHGIPVPLRDQPLEVLMALLERPGEVVTREELRNRLWNGVAFGDFEAALNTAMSRLRRALNEPAESPRFIETVPKRGYRFIAEVRPSEPLQLSVAVMPLADRSTGAGGEYFAEGFTEELMRVLSRVPGLRVVRGAVPRGAGGKYDATQLARKLGVQMIVDGTVERAAERIRIGLRLVQAAGETELWSERFEGEWKDVFRIQDTVCERVAQALELRLLPAPGGKRPGNSDAYAAYLRGQYLSKRATPANLERSLAYYEEAIRLDPDYALPYHGAAISHMLRTLLGGAPPGPALAEAERFTARAISLDADSAMVQNTLAMLRMWQWKWEEAEAAYRRAIALEPANPHPHMMYALECSFLGRHEDALREARTAVHLDPVDPIMNFRLVQCCYYARRYDEAIRNGRTAIELAADFPSTYGYLAWSLAAAGEIDEAWRMARHARTLAGGQPAMEGVFGYVAAVSGHTADAREVLRSLEARRRNGQALAIPIAWTHAGLEDQEAAIAWLETAWADREPYLASIGVFPGYDTLRGDSRFERIAHRVVFLRAPY